MKALMVAALTLTLAVPATAQDVIPLRELSAYLNGIATAQGGFTQVNSDGTVSTGTLYMHRPGRMRFEYDGEDTLVMAGGGQLAIFDGRSNSLPEQYPLRETPLSVILAQDVDLTRNEMVMAHAGDGTTTSVIARDPERPDIGNIELVFTGDPVELRQWIITDQSGQQTTVVLGGLELGERIPAILFSISQEVEARGL